MPRRAAAYLSDLLEACDAIDDVLAGVDWPTYAITRAIRSSVEREFIIIGEAMNALVRVMPEAASGVSKARMIISFRNILTHEYKAVDDETVYAIARNEIPKLRRECINLMERLGETG